MNFYLAEKKVIPMTNELTYLNNSLSMWEDINQIEEIKKIFAPTLTDMEFKVFVGMGKATGLNPFLKEIWCVKYGKDREGNELPAQVFIGRDGYRKGAHLSTKYDYHQVDAVYENDEFKVINGEVSHSYNLKDRGKLRGAYCLVKLKTSSKPHYVFVDVEEYSTGQSLWAEVSYKDNKYGGKYKVGGKPSTMIKKVAEAQGLRMALDIFEGTYSEYEAFNNQMDNNKERVIQGTTQTERLKSLLINKNITSDTISVDNDGVIIEAGENIKEAAIEADNQAASSETINRIGIAMDERDFDSERRKKVLAYFKVEKLSDLTEAQAKAFFVQIGVT